ncbi:MAG TPA: hypothetical protein DEQ54_02970, partial [Firmicutes bacterium]|nr:hypothetical protein [Bacillota bacterium]
VKDAGVVGPIPAEIPPEKSAGESAGSAGKTPAKTESTAPTGESSVSAGTSAAPVGESTASTKESGVKESPEPTQGRTEPAKVSTAPVRESTTPATTSTTTRESAAPAKEKMVMPVQGKILSDFGWRKHPVYRDWRYHTGVDIEAPDGSPVGAAFSGKIVGSDTERELGLCVVIEHANGITTKYGHLESVSVKPGDQVKQGQIIGRSGSSGVTSGSYLHFEVISQNEAVDPLTFQ